MDELGAGWMLEKEAWSMSVNRMIWDSGYWAELQVYCG